VKLTGLEIRDTPHWLRPWIHFLVWLPDARVTWRGDLIAGLTGAVVVIPQAVAFADIAGMPPEYGLYAGMIPAIVAALFGSSRFLFSGPTTAASVVLFSSLSAFAEPESSQYVSLALTLTLMVGTIELVLGLVRMGALVNFISHAVVVGFTAGAALWILTKQVSHFFGIDSSVAGNLFGAWSDFLGHAGQINPYVTAVGVVTLAAGLATKRWWPRVPHLLAAMISGSLLGVILNVVWGADRTGIVTVGALPASLPPLSRPDLSLATIKELMPTALAVTLFALTEALSIARALAQREGQRIDGNQEFIGQGLSNIAGSFFSGYVATGSFNRSALNYQAGAKTPLAAMSAGMFLIVLVVMLAPLAAYLPKAAMAGILFIVLSGLIDFKQIRHIIKTSRPDAAVLLVTFSGAIFLDLEFAIFLGVMLSLVLYLNRTAHPRVLPQVPEPEIRRLTSNPYLPQCPQVGIVRIDGSLFFGAVAYVEEQIERLKTLFPGQKRLLLICSGINHIDISGIEMLSNVVRERRAEGGELFLYGVKPQVARMLEKSGLRAELGADHIIGSKTRALRTVVTRLDPEICRNCPHDVFHECAENRARGVRAAQDSS